MHKTVRSNLSLDAGQRYFYACYGLQGCVFDELSEVIRAPDIMSAKRLAVESGPEWAGDISVEEIQASEVNELLMHRDDTRRDVRLTAVRSA